jgi:uncharacterized protein (DUF1330 family)
MADCGQRLRTAGATQFSERLFGPPAMLVLNGLLAGGHRIVTARRGALQRIDGVLRPLPCFVVLEVFGHAVEIILFFEKRFSKDVFGLFRSASELAEFPCDGRHSYLPPSGQPNARPGRGKLGPLTANPILTVPRNLTRLRTSSERGARVDISLTPEWRLHMAKGYWIGRVDVNNEEGFKPYAAANPATFKKFGGRYVVRGGKFDVAEGNSRARNVVIEFPDYASALACYRSPEYQENIKARLPHSVIDLIVIEGYDGPQP